MPRITLNHAHTLGAALAQQRVSGMIDGLRERYGIHSEWSGDTLTFSGTGISGTLVAEPAAVRIDVRLGLLLTPLKPTIEAELRRHLEQCLQSPAA